jgi:hypothetical protein
MRQLICTETKDGEWTIQEGLTISNGLCADEAIFQIISLIHPYVQKPFFSTTNLEISYDERMALLEHRHKKRTQTFPADGEQPSLFTGGDPAEA